MNHFDAIMATKRSARLVLFVGIMALMASTLEGCAGLAIGGAATTVGLVNDRRTTGTLIEDQAIELKARRALHEQKELNSQTHISVTSYNTVVLVSGEAPTEEMRNLVIDTVRNVEKVRHVYDEVSIAGPSSLLSRSADSLVTAKVKTRILTIKDFNGMRVKVVTENGVVYLMGLLDKEESDIVANAARKVGGVQKVVKLFEH